MPRVTTRELTYCALFAALIAAGAFGTIPLGTVPITLQLLFVLLAGMALGPRLAALSVAAYLALGLVAPVYAGGTSGLGFLLGPTGGYLCAFVPAAVVTGLVVKTGPPTLPRFIGGGLAGIAPVYALGTIWLSMYLQVDMETAIAAGAAPFLWLDALKAMAAGLAARSLVNLPLGLPVPQQDR